MAVAKLLDHQIGFLQPASTPTFPQVFTHVSRVVNSYRVGTPGRSLYLSYTLMCAEWDLGLHDVSEEASKLLTSSFDGFLRYAFSASSICRMLCADPFGHGVEQQRFRPGPSFTLSDDPTWMHVLCIPIQTVHTCNKLALDCTLLMHHTVHFFALWITEGYASYIILCLMHSILMRSRSFLKCSGGKSRNKDTCAM